MNARTAVIAGGTGLVGSHLLDLLLEDAAWDRVVSIGRRPVERDHPKLEQRIVGFPAVGELPQAHDVFCCVGTTMKKAGSRNGFKMVDHDAVIQIAGSAFRNGAHQFLHVTAMGASPKSSIFYNRIKGEAEYFVNAMGIPTTVAFRPSMLDGHRGEHRPAEAVGLLVMRGLAPVLGRFRPTAARDVARAMVVEAKRNEPGRRIVEAHDIARLARSAHRAS
jgi:uncharacterized protein YbjT (DUF2867 family)